MDESFVLVFLFYTLFYTAGFCGAIAGYNAKKKGYSYAAYYCLGFFLGIIGLIVALVVREKEERRSNETEMLVYYRQLFDAGLITQDIYIFKRNEMLSRIGQMQAQPIEDEGQKRTVIWISAIITVSGAVLCIIQLVCLAKSSGAPALYSDQVGFFRVVLFVSLIMALIIVAIGCLGLYARKKDKKASMIEVVGVALLALSIILIIVSFIANMLALPAYSRCFAYPVSGLSGSPFFTLFASVFRLNLIVGGLASFIAFNSGIYAALYYKTLAESYACAEQGHIEWLKYSPVENGAYWGYPQYQSSQTVRSRNLYNRNVQEMNSGRINRGTWRFGS